MKTSLMIFIFFIIPQFSLSQTKFDSGYNSGYEKGFCYDKGITCISPVPPISPIPNVNESMSSYTDGYNRGFKDGISSKGNSEEDRGRYKTSKPEFKDFSRNSNGTTQLLLMALQKKKEVENRLKEIFQEGYSDIEDYDAGNDVNIKNLKVEYLNKIENLAENAGVILRNNNNDFKALISQLQNIYDEFYFKVQKK